MKYVLTHEKINGGLKLEYFPNGMIRMFEFDCEISQELWDFIMNEFPTEESCLKGQRFKNFVIASPLEDISFAAFWNAYNYKVGNKTRAEKLWNLLSDVQKMQVLIRIKAYNVFLMAHPAQERLYPETFLFQRRWENEFK